MHGEEPSMKQSKKNKRKKIEKELDSVVTFTDGTSEKSVEKKKKTTKKNKEEGAVNVEEDNCKVEVEPELKNVDDEDKNRGEEGNNEKADVNSSLQEEAKLEKQPKKKKLKSKSNENDIEEEVRVDFKDLSTFETSGNNIEKKKKKKEKKKKLESEAANEVKEDNHEKMVDLELRNSKKKFKDEGHEKDDTSSSLLEESTGAHKNHKKKGKEKVINKSPSPQTEEEVIGEGDTLTKEFQTSGSSKKKRKRTAISGGSEDAVLSEKKKGKKNDKIHEDGRKSSSRKADGTSANKANGKASSSKNKMSGDTSEGPVSKKKARRVSFSSDVEVFPPHNNSDVKTYDENNLVHGRRFSLEEDQLIRDAVFKYIERNQLGEEGLKMVLNPGQNPEVRHCWREIGTALPWRPALSVKYRAQILFERSEERGFTEEECEIIRKFRAEHGPQWTKLADILGKQRTHLKDKWRRMRLPNVKIGPWSQDEYQTLFDLVNMNLRMRAFEEASSSNAMIRENISWEAISDRLTTRYMYACCHKWYDQLTSPFVREGLWADTDDYRLLSALHEQDFCNIEDVEWDYLLPHRSGEVCRKRWEEMARHLGGYRERTFLEQVDVLSKRYCGDMLQYRKGSKEDES